MPNTAAADSAALGLTLAPSKTISIRDLIDIVRLAEGLGYHSFWLPETWGPDAATLLATLAVETNSICLASGVFNVYSRSAALLAQTATTLQHLSGGRFVLGLGASGPRVIEAWHGVPFDRPVQRTREYVKVIRLALSGERVDFSGDVLAVSGFRLSLVPDTPVPVYVAALGPRNVRMAGEVADGWLPIFAPLGHMADLRQDLEAGAHSAGRDPGDVRCAAFLPFAVGARAVRLLQEQLAYYVGGMGTFYERFVARTGFEADAARIRHAWQSGNRLAAVQAVESDLVGAFTLGSDPVIARRKLDAYRSSGVEIPIVALPYGCTADEAREAIRALAPEAVSGGAGTHLV